LYLHQAESGETGNPPLGLLSEKVPGNELPDTYNYPESQRKVRADIPVLGYTTPPMPEDMEIVGPVSLVLYAASTAADMDWVIKLDDIAPNGAAQVVTKGFLKAAYREVDPEKSRPGQPFHPYLQPSPIEKDKIYEYEIELLPIFRTFKVGHRLRLRIASNDFFGQDPLNYHTPVFQIATNTVYHNKQFPSHLVLPIIPAGQTGKELPRPSLNYNPMANVLSKLSTEKVTKQSSK
jgi:putative CocE/NonD family hydrolase